MNYCEFKLGEPFDSELRAAKARREETNNPREKSRANKDIRAIRLRSARKLGTHTEAQWLGLCAAFEARCVLCGDIRPLQKDHIVPIYQGGSDGIENIQPLCHPCNASKGPDCTNWVEFRIEHGFDE